MHEDSMYKKSARGIAMNEVNIGWCEYGDLQMNKECQDRCD